MNKRRKSAPGNRRAAANEQGNSLRIIGGKWRGRQLHFPTAQGLRPSADRVRETVFNWLTPWLPEAHCLDLFSGSGAFGFEAISRGGESALLIDSASLACRSLHAHREMLNAQGQITVVHGDALDWLRNTRNGPFDIVFLDPPFQDNLLPRTLALLERSPVVQAGTVIYLECALQQTIQLPAHWQTLRHKQAGQVSYALIEIGERTDN